MRLLQVWNCWILIIAYTPNKKKKLDQFSMRQFGIRVAHNTMKSIEILLSFITIWCFILQHGNCLLCLIVTCNRRIVTFTLCEISVPVLPYCLKHLWRTVNCVCMSMYLWVFKTDMYKDDSHFGKFSVSQN